jgi:conjugal transfer pilus assembly protein TraF
MSRTPTIHPSFVLIVLWGGLLAGLLLAKSTSASSVSSFFGEHARGWHWYEVMPVMEEAQQKEEKPGERSGEKSGEKQAVFPPTPTELVKAYQKELESRLHAAWVYPTPQNVRAYQEMQKDLMNRSKLFTTVWMQNVYQNPELDHTLVSPVNQQARHLQVDLEKERTFKVIRGLSETFGLFFFFSGDCPYCHQFAPIVKRFADTYGWKVVAISIDGGRLGEFPEAQVDNGLFQLWNLKVLPALIAVNPQSREAIPVAYGLTSLDEMENRIMSLVGDKS